MCQIPNALNRLRSCLMLLEHAAGLRSGRTEDTSCGITHIIDLESDDDGLDTEQADFEEARGQQHEGERHTGKLESTIKCAKADGTRCAMGERGEDIESDLTSGSSDDNLLLLQRASQRERDGLRRSGRYRKVTSKLM
jgi:hypothetical protein